MSISTPTISATTLIGTAEFIRSNFGERSLNYAYEISGIAPGSPLLQNAFIPEKSILTFVESAARLSGEHQLGLLLAPYLSIDFYGVLAEYVKNSATLGEGLRRFLHVLPYHASAHSFAVIRNGDMVKWQYNHAVIGAPNYDHLLFGALGTIVNFIREFAGPDWLPNRIELDIPKPRTMSLFEQMYPCPIIFDAPEYCLIFDYELLGIHRCKKMPTRPTTISDVMRSRLLPAPTGLYEITTNIIKSQMQSSQTSLDNASRLLGCSNSTMQRELNYLGLTFRSLTTQIKMKLASELLRETGMSITDIANELGYSSHSHFTRAYHKATDVTPSQFRQQLQQKTKTGF